MNKIFKLVTPKNVAMVFGFALTLAIDHWVRSELRKHNAIREDISGQSNAKSNDNTQQGIIEVSAEELQEITDTLTEEA